jgi:alcohol dehydrogenase class IV
MASSACGSGAAYSFARGKPELGALLLGLSILNFGMGIYHSIPHNTSE